MEKRRRRYAVLLCAGENEYVRKVYGGYSEVFFRLLGGAKTSETEKEEEEEEWETFRARDGELPLKDDEIGRFDGFVITGSCSDAHGDDEWILDLIMLVRRLDSLRKKVLGICFGHQILCRALGGKTGRARKGWDLGVTTIHFTAASKNLLFASPFDHLPLSFSVFECHQDEVLELPVGAEVLGWSKKTPVEIFRYGEHMMGIQGHPEYTKDIFLNLLDRLLHRNLIKDYEAEIARASMAEREPEREAWKRLCKAFLKS